MADKPRVRPRVLFISSDESLKENVYKMFRAEPVDLYYKETTGIAFKTLDRETFEMILLDGTFEGETHVLVELKKLVKHPAHPSVILMVNAGDIHIAIEALQIGAINFISIPFDDAMFSNTVLKDLDLLIDIKKMKDIEPVISRNRLLLRIPSNLKFLGGTIFEIMENAVKNRFPVDVYQHEIKLALSEAVVNAIIHGNKQMPTKYVHIEAMITPDVFNIKITDEGPGFNTDNIPDPTLPENIIKVGGRGIFLMRCYMDEVKFNEKGNQLMIKLTSKEDQ